MKYYYLLLAVFLAGCNFSAKPKKHYEITFEVQPGTKQEELYPIINAFGNRLLQFGSKDDYKIDLRKNILSVSINTPDSIDRIVRVLTTTGKLEFLETYSLPEMNPYIITADRELALVVHAQKGQKETYGSLDSAMQVPTRDNHPILSLMGMYTTQDESTGQTVLVDGPTIGFALEKETVELLKLLNSPTARAIFPNDARFMISAKPHPENKDFFHIYAIKVPSPDAQPITGDLITEVKVYLDKPSPELGLRMNGEGTGLWKKLTAKNVGRSLAIVIDGKVFSAPKVVSEITGGRISISGGFTIDEAYDMAAIIKAGNISRLPLRLIEVK